MEARTWPSSASQLEAPPEASRRRLEGTRSTGSAPCLCRRPSLPRPPPLGARSGSLRVRPWP
eukprot:4938857-Pyramimonas_sp.AAC.1